MADDDDEYLPDLEEIPAHNTRYRERIHQATQRDAENNTEASIGGETVNATTKRQTRLPADNETVKRMLKDIEIKLKGQDITIDTLVQVLKAALTLQLKHLQEKKRKEGTGKSKHQT